MVLVSVNSADPVNGFDFTNDFSEALVLEPNSTISLVSLLFERENKFVVSAQNNRFVIKQGSSTAPDEVITINQSPTYTGATLAQELQRALNINGALKGYNYQCIYHSKTSKFEISSSFHQGGLTETEIVNTDSTNPHNGQPLNSGTEIVPIAGGGFDFSQHTDRTSSYVKSADLLETTIIPSKSNGGSFVRATIPAVLTTPAQESRAIVIGIWSNQLQPNLPIETITTELSANTNLSWLDAGLVILKDSNGRSAIKVIENGIDIGLKDAGFLNREFVLQAGDAFSVNLYGDSAFPEYKYKRDGVWYPLRVGGGGDNGIQLFDVQAHRGYNFWAVFAGDSDKNITLPGFTQDGQGIHDKNYVEVYPNQELIGFGQLVGFHQNKYILEGAEGAISNTMISDHNPEPDSASAFEPTIHLNVNNLPLRSIVGKKFEANATINSVPKGSQNGISRLLAQFPRYHESNGNSSVDKFGPFYYDYFPYSVRLKNAQCINLNELHISLTNINGTLATDVKLCNILLNISNEENVGGYGRESIGLPQQRHQTQEQRDVLKSQMIPLKG